MIKDMKKYFLAVIMLVLLISFVACDKKSEDNEEESTTENSKEPGDDIIMEEVEFKYVLNDICDIMDWLDAKADKGKLKSEKIYMHKIDSESGEDKENCLEQTIYTEDGDIQNHIVYNEELLSDYKENNKSIVRKSEDITRTPFSGDEFKSQYVIEYNSGAYIVYEYMLLRGNWDGDTFQIKVKEYDDDSKLIKGTEYLYEKDMLTSAIVYWDEENKDNDYVEILFEYHIDEYDVVIEEDVNVGIKSKVVIVSKYDREANRDICYVVKKVDYDLEGNVIEITIFNQEKLDEYENRNIEVVNNSANIVDIKVERDSEEETYYVYYDSGESVTYRVQGDYLVASYSDANGEFIKTTQTSYTNGVLTEVFEFWGEDGWTDDFAQTWYSYYSDSENDNYNTTNVYRGEVITDGDNVYLTMDINDSYTHHDITYVYGEEKYEEWVELAQNHPKYEVEGYGEVQGIKLDVSNVKKVVEFADGQDMMFDYEECGFFILHNDNTVSFYHMSDALEGKSEVKKVDVENVVDIVSVSTNAWSTYFVDAEGNMTIADMYIK